MSDNQVITVPRDEVERLVKLLQYQAHPYPSPHAAFWQGQLDKPIPATHAQRFWSFEAKNIRCVREQDYDTLQQRLDAACAGLKWESDRNKLLLERVNELEAETLPDPTLCSFYDATDYPGLVRELVGHVSQLQDSAKRNVKPWEDTFPPTLLPAYIERLNAANTAAQLQGEPVTVVQQERTPKDYAIEHAEYMATSADHVLAEYQTYGLALLAVDEGGDDGEGELIEAVDSARQDLQEALLTLHSRVYEFRKRSARIGAVDSDAEA